MSAPDTNLKKQAKRHRPAMYAISAMLLLAAVFIVTAAVIRGVSQDDLGEADNTQTQAAPTQAAPVVVADP